ncbi:MAG: leucine-rich repeat protein [Clostridia bacterium]|nr:leucine-rich repeat protein [Clostridia bacterium]
MRNVKVSRFLLIVIVLSIVCMLNVTVDAAGRKYGPCGKNVKFVLETDGVLTISGTGEMKDYQGIGDISPWGTEVKSIIIEDGVTHIGSSAFYNCTAESVTIPDSVTSIGNAAFANCENLKTVTIPGSIKVLSGSAFSGCSALEEVVIGNGTETIEDGVFYGCYGLETVSIPESVTFISERAISSKPGGGYPAIICERDTYAQSFANENGMPVYLPPLWTIDTNGVLTVTGIGLINDCSPENPAPWYERRDEIKSVVIGDGLIEIGSYAFADCVNLTEITVSGDVRKINGAAFDGCVLLERVNYPDLVKWCEIEFTDESANPLGYAKELYIGGELLTSLALEGEITVISDYAFCGYESLVSIVAPDLDSGLDTAAIELGKAVFKNCVNLQKADFTYRSRDFKDSVFEGCTSLSEFYGESNVIGYRAFYGTAIKNYTLNYEIETIGAEAFANCPYLKQVTIHDITGKIGTDAFAGSPELVVRCSVGSALEEYAKSNSIKYDDVTKYCGYDIVWEIDENGVLTMSGSGEAYNSYHPWDNVKSDIKHVVVKEGVVRIGSNAFYDCPALETVSLPDGILKLEGFQECTSLKQINVPDSVLSIDTATFFCCTSLESIVLSDNIERIGHEAFSGCTALKSIKLPANLTFIRSSAFVACKSLTDVVIPDGVTKIEGEIFAACGNIRVTLPASVTEIGDRFFGGGFMLYADSYAIICEPGSYAESYAKANDIPYRYTRFTDVEEGKWYTQGISYCYANEYMSGVSLDEFSYKATMNRQMFATILAKIDGADTSSYNEMTFSDVPAGQWYSNAIEWAAQNGYAAGMGEGIFGRKNPVTREQMAMFFYTYSEVNGIDVTGRADITGYADYDRVHGYALEAMSWAVSEQLITGTGETTLSPRDSATRAQVAVIIKAYVENVKNAVVEAPEVPAE